MREPLPLRRRASMVRWVALMAVACCGVLSPSHAQIVTLTDNNSVAQVNVGSQAGMFNWFVQGQDQLAQQWFWYSIGNTAPQSIDTISAPTISLYNGTRGLSVMYNNGSYSVSIDYLLSGGSVVGPGQFAASDIGENIRILNQTANPLSFKFYQYSDFDLGGLGNDTVQLGQNLRGLFNEASQTDPLAGLTETVVTPGAIHGEANLFPTTLATLNNGINPVTLNDTVGPVGPGDATWALEWDFVINPGATALISKDKYLTVLIPEPSSLTLLGLGAAVALAWKRRRAAG